MKFTSPERLRQQKRKADPPPSAKDDNVRQATATTGVGLKGFDAWVSLAPSGSFDCADHDGAVICFAQDDGSLWGDKKQMRKADPPPSAKDDNLWVVTVTVPGL